MATIRDVAEQAGVATMTVSRVINNSGYVSDATRAKVEAAITDLGYVPNMLGPSLRFNQTNTLALILTDITNPFWTTVSSRCRRCRARAKLQRHPLQHRRKPAKTRPIFEYVVESGVSTASCLYQQTTRQNQSSLFKSRTCRSSSWIAACPNVDVDVVRGDSFWRCLSTSKTSRCIRTSGNRSSIRPTKHIYLNRTCRWLSSGNG